MKNKIFAVLMALPILLGCLLFTGCSSKGCSASGCLMSADFKCRDCAAGCIEWLGDFSDCSSILCNIIMGEKCTDGLYVAPCYGIAGWVRHCSPESCDSNPTMDDFSRVSSENYQISYTYRTEEMPNLTMHYQVTLQVDLRAYTDLENVWVSLDVSDVNGNNQADVSFYFADSIEKGEQGYQTCTVTFSYPGEIRDTINIVHKDKYRLSVQNIRVYARNQ